MSESTRHRMKKVLPKIVLSVTGLSSSLMLGGCNLVLLDPKGPVGQAEKDLIVMCASAMLLIVIPVIIASLVIARRYRSTNKNATYSPKWDFSAKIETLIWGIPICLIAFLAYHTFVSCHELDPYKPLVVKEASVKPVKVQVVALDWKWLFIYPDEGIATVNEMAMPVNAPVEFVLTSDAVMNSFYIPQLGSQIYVMAGMQTQLHLMASEAGNYAGVSNNYSGAGYSDMKFHALALNQDAYQEWINKVKASSKVLDTESYAKLAVKSIKHPVEYFSAVDHGLFENIVAKYNNGMVADKDSGKMIHMDSNMSGMHTKE